MKRNKTMENVIVFNDAKYVLREARQMHDTCKNCAFGTRFGDCMIQDQDLSCVYEAMKQNKRMMFAYFVRIG